MSSPAPQALPLRLRLGYATAETGLNAVEVLVRLYLLSFYTDAVGLSPFWAGLAGLIGLLWDAVTDPVMGQISDRTYARFRGRHPYLILGSALLAGALLVLFSPPPLENELAAFSYLLGSYLLLNTALTVLAVPYNAMVGDLTQDRDERSVLFAFRFAFGNIGGILAAGIPGVFLVRTADGALAGDGMSSVAAILAAVVLLSALLTWQQTRSHSAPPEAQAPDSLRQAFRTIRTNQAFLVLIVAYFVANAGIALNSTLARYYYLYRLRLTESEVGLLLMTFMLILTLSLVLWVKLSERFGKLTPLRWGAGLLGLGTCIVYPLLPAESFGTTLFFAGGVLGGLVGSVVLLDSMLTDVINLDHLRSGRYRGGIYFGLWRFAAKVSRGIAFFGTGALLGAIGFEANQEQSPETLQWLGLLFGPGVGGFLLIAIAVMIPYRYTDAKQRQVQRLLQAKNSEG